MSLNVVAWRWTPFKGYRNEFPVETVNTLRRMVLRHYPDVGRFICVTDDPSGFDPGIEALPLWDDFPGVRSPHDSGMARPKNPSCYRRLRMFHPDAAQWFGERFVAVDLDMVFTGDLRPLWNRPEDFVMTGDTNRTTHYNGSMLLLTAGSRPRVWTEFDPAMSPRKTLSAGFHGSDQAWISYCLGAGEATWTKADGVYSYRNHLTPRRDRFPSDARVVNFHGAVKPWCLQVSDLPWIREHYYAPEVAAA